MDIPITGTTTNNIGGRQHLHTSASTSKIPTRIQTFRSIPQHEQQQHPKHNTLPSTASINHIPTLVEIKRIGRKGRRSRRDEQRWAQNKNKEKNFKTHQFFKIVENSMNLFRTRFERETTRHMTKSFGFCADKHLPTWKNATIQLANKRTKDYFNKIKNGLS